MLYLFYPCLKDVNYQKALSEFTKEVEKDLNKIYNSKVDCWGTYAPPYLVVKSDDEEKVLDIYSRLNEHLINEHSSILPLVINDNPYDLAKLDLLNNSNKVTSAVKN